MAAKITPVTMPKWGMEMTEGTLTCWLVAEGDTITQRQEIFEAETDKLSSACEADAGGVVRRILATPGNVYEVGELMAVIADASVSDADIDAFVAQYKPEDPDDAAVAEAEAEPAKPEPTAYAASPRSASAAQSTGLSADAVHVLIEEKGLDISPVAARLAAEHGFDPSELKGTGRLGRISLADVRAALGDVPVRAPKVNASPVARRLAKLKGLDLAALSGSGGRGKVLKRDVLEAKPVVLGGGGASGTMGPAVPTFAPLSSMRRTIAKRLQASKQTNPHIYLRVEVAVGALMALRKDFNAGREARGEAKVSVNDFIIRATALALKQVPDANVQFAETELRQFSQADVGVAVALEGGLVTPIIRAAERKPVGTIAAEVADLAHRAREGGLKPAEIDGGTITVSNLGMFGIRDFDAIINPPQAAILAIGAVEERPANVDGVLALAPLMNVSMSCDHRAIDGAVGAAYLAAFKALLEQPLSLLS